MSRPSLTQQKPNHCFLSPFSTMAGRNYSMPATIRNGLGCDTSTFAGRPGAASAVTTDSFFGPDLDLPVLPVFGLVAQDIVRVRVPVRHHCHRRCLHRCHCLQSVLAMAAVNTSCQCLSRSPMRRVDLGSLLASNGRTLVVDARVANGVHFRPPALPVAWVGLVSGKSRL